MKAMTVRDAILALIDHPLDAKVYVGKGMGPLGSVSGEIPDTADRVYVVLKPVTRS